MTAVPVSGNALAVIILLLVSVSGCSPERADSDSPGAQEVPAAQEDTAAPSFQVDHVIVAIRDLQTGMDRFEELTGVRPTLGGDHPGRGTRNALVALGPEVYLELLALQEGVEQIEDAPGLEGLTELSPWGWAASTTRLESTVDLLRNAGYGAADPVAGSRVTPDDGLLSWRTASLEEPEIRGGPFFIEWGADSPHPSTTSPPGCELAALKVLTPDAELLRSLTDLLNLPVEVEAIDDPVERYEVELRCPGGTVTFGSSGA
jgi:hypothetical protein